VSFIAGDYLAPQRYPHVETERLEAELCQLTADLIDLRRDHASLSVSHNARFYQTFMDANGESVAGRNRLAENAVREIEQERIQAEGNILCVQDLCALVLTILEQRRHGWPSPTPPISNGNPSVISHPAATPRVVPR
jgi:hypothetical protein